MEHVGEEVDRIRHDNNQLRLENTQLRALLATNGIAVKPLNTQVTAVATAADVLVQLMQEGASLLKEREALEAENRALLAEISAPSEGSEAAAKSEELDALEQLAPLLAEGQLLRDERRQLREERRALMGDASVVSSPEESEVGALELLLPLLSEADGLKAERETLRSERGYLRAALEAAGLERAASEIHVQTEEDRDLELRILGAVEDVKRENATLEAEVVELLDVNARLRPASSIADEPRAEEVPVQVELPEVPAAAEEAAREALTVRSAAGSVEPVEVMTAAFAAMPSPVAAEASKSAPQVPEEVPVLAAASLLAATLALVPAASSESRPDVAATQVPAVLEDTSGPLPLRSLFAMTAPAGDALAAAVAPFEQTVITLLELPAAGPAPAPTLPIPKAAAAPAVKAEKPAPLWVMPRPLPGSPQARDARRQAAKSREALAAAAAAGRRRKVPVPDWAKTPMQRPAIELIRELEGSTSPHAYKAPPLPTWDVPEEDPHSAHARRKQAMSKLLKNQMFETASAVAGIPFPFIPFAPPDSPKARAMQSPAKKRQADKAAAEIDAFPEWDTEKSLRGALHTLMRGFA